MLHSRQFHKQVSLARDEAKGRIVRYITLKDGRPASLYEVEVMDLATRHTRMLTSTTDMHFPVTGRPFEDRKEALTFFEAQVAESLKAGFDSSVD